MGDSGSVYDALDEQAVATIRAGLGRVLASDAFRAAPQLSAFLAFVVERAVEGRGAELKGYTIAVEALGRPADFDPQLDPIVRVEAGRLRRTLSQYYAEEGRSDPVRITMPVGGYVPVFAPTGGIADAVPETDEPEQHYFADASEPAGVQPADPSVDRVQPSGAGPARRWPALAGLALVIAIGLPAAWYLTSRSAPPVLAGRSMPASEIATRSRPAAMADSQLTVVAITIPEIPADPKLAEILRRFSGLLVDAMARFDDLVMIKAPPAGSGPPPDADYVFEMNVQTVEGATEGFGRLLSAGDGRVVWTASSSRQLPRGVEDPELVEIARRTAVRLAEPFGVIHADSRQYAASPTMRCLFKAIDFRRTLKAEDHLAARTCLTGLIEQDPDFYPAWAYLAILTLSEQASSLNPLPEPPLDRALTAALTAVRLAPSSARALQALMVARFARGAIEDGIKAGRDALIRNPYDPEIMAALGSLYVRLNRPAEGLPLLERAIETSAGHPPWYDFFAFLAAHLTGARRLVEPSATTLVADGSPYGLLARALQATSSGDLAGASRTLKKLGDAAPLFAADPHLYLKRKAFDQAVIERILSDLGPALNRP